MLLRSLEVENFRCLRRAALTFGRGLNVLFGPNDLGKSTLAEALRAAFLLPPMAKAAEEFTPWGANVVPSVVVVFEHEETVWKVSKAFGSRGSALLEKLTASGGWKEEARGREVDGKLRELLAWGIPAPGGKNAPRGLPESYLTTALLGRQDGVTEVLDTSIDKDGADTGRAWITSALGVLAQDPVTSKLLERLEERTQAVFTPTGQHKKTQDSPLFRATNDVRLQQESLERFEQAVERSRTIERSIQTLMEKRAVAAGECLRLERLSELFQAIKQKEEAVERARRDWETRESARRLVATLDEELKAREAARTELDARLQALQAELHGAQARLAKVTGAQEQALAAAATTREARRAELRVQRDAAERRIQSARDVMQARGHLKQRESDLDQARAALREAKSVVEQAQRIVELAGLLKRRTEAKGLIEARRTGEIEVEKHAARVRQTEDQLKKAEGELELAESLVTAQKEAQAHAEREAAARELREQTVRAGLTRAEGTEREARAQLARVKNAAAWSQRLAEAMQTLSGLEASESALEAELAANRNAKDGLEAKSRHPAPRPVGVSLTAGIVGVVTVGGLALLLGLHPALGAAVGVAAGFAAAGVVALLLRHRSMRAAAEARRRALADLAKGRETLLERRNQVAAKREGALARVDSARAERDQAAAAAPQGGIDEAEHRLAQAGAESAKIRAELAAIEAGSAARAMATPPAIAEGEAAVALVKSQIAEQRLTLDERRRGLGQAQVRLEAADVAAQAIDLEVLDRQASPLLALAGNGEVPPVDAAETRLAAAKDKEVEWETSTRVAGERLADAQTRLRQLAEALVKEVSTTAPQATLESQAEERILAAAEQSRTQAEEALQRLDEDAANTVAAQQQALQQAQAAVDKLEQDLALSKPLADEAVRSCEESRTKHAEARGKAEAVQAPVPLRQEDVVAAEQELAEARLALATDESLAPSEDPATVESLLRQRQHEVERVDKDLHEARGQLKFVGGVVVRDQCDQQRETLERLRHKAAELELECNATKRLFDVFKEVEGKHAAHLGNCLAKPVAERFAELTQGRYAQVGLDPTLRLRAVVAKGDDRDPASLSAGTRDQLATLIRLALAAHLGSVLLLDDQLTQTDARRLQWFRDQLGTSVRRHGHQIIVITCRPLDYVNAEHLLQAPDAGFESEDGLTVIDLEAMLARK